MHRVTENVNKEGDLRRQLHVYFSNNPCLLVLRACSRVVGLWSLAILARDPHTCQYGARALQVSPAVDSEKLTGLLAHSRSARERELC